MKFSRVVVGKVSVKITAFLLAIVYLSLKF